MFEQRYTIFIIIYLQCALSLHVIKTNKNAKNDLFPSLTKTINFGDKSHVNPVINVNKLSRNFLGKAKLVSRVIPHSYNSGPYEYDSKLNTLYKPLIRFHVKTPIKKVKDETKNSKLLAYAIIFNKNNDKNEAKTKDFNDLIEFLRKGPYKNTLDTLMDKSNEEFDDLKPGLKPFSDEEERTTKAPVVIPEYPFWNYWTYSKTIHQDDCPGNLVKLGEMCISVAGHRRGNTHT